MTRPVRLPLLRASEMADGWLVAAFGVTATRLRRQIVRVLVARRDESFMSHVPPAVEVVLPEPIYQRLAPELGRLQGELERRVTKAVYGDHWCDQPVHVLLSSNDEAVGSEQPWFRVTVLAGAADLQATRPAADDETALAPAAAFEIEGPNGWRVRMDAGAPHCYLGRRVVGMGHIDHPTVSSRHAELRYRAGYLSLRDLGSLNGVRVNAERVLQAELHHGDRISLGNVTLQVRSAQNTMIENEETVQA